MTPLKKCTKCGEEKPATLEFFHKCSKVKSGLTASCKGCNAVVISEWNKANRRNPIKEKQCLFCSKSFETRNPIKKYCSGKCSYKAHLCTEKAKTRKQKYEKEYARRWRKLNKDLSRARSKKWYHTHPEHAKMIYRNRSRRQISELRDIYVKRVLRQAGISNDLLTPELIELQRIYLKGKRLIKQLL